MVNEGRYVQCYFKIISLGNNLRSLILLQSMASTRGGRCLQAPSFAARGGWSLEGWMERVCYLQTLEHTACGVEETICLSDAPTRRAWLGSTPAQGLSSGCFLAPSDTSWSPTGLYPCPGVPKVSSLKGWVSVLTSVVVR